VRPTRRIMARLAVMTVAAGLPVLLVAAAASAHVTVSSDDASQGGYAKLTFRVPNETDDTDTTKVQVFFPQSQPLASVSIQPVPGWSHQVRTTKLATPISSDDGQVTEAVSEVTWTADSKATSIKPGEFQEFDISAGPLPKAPAMVFKTLQTYSDGTIVRWIDATPAGGPEPEHPAPTLTLSAATSATDSGSSSGSGRATVALVLSIVAVVLAAGAAGASLLRRKGPPGPS
jgi:periplasmic copper chaperone A